MARKRRKSQNQPLDQIIDTLAVLARPEFLGLTLIVISVFTLLSLFTGSRGTVTGFWIDFLQSLTGVAVWGIPLLTGVIGLWMVIRVIEKMPDLPWQRPAGLVLFFISYVTGLTLWLPQNQRLARVEAGEAGGLLGLWLANLSEAALSTWGAWAVVTFLGITGLILLTDRLVPDLLLDSWDALVDLYEGWRMRDQERAIDLQPELPMASGELPWWKRLLPARHHDEDDEPVINAPLAGQRSAPAQNRQTQTQRGQAPAPQPAAQQTRQPLTRPSEDAALTPRIFGGVQSWQLPRLDDMLSDWDRYVDSYEKIRERGKLIEQTLDLFGVPARFKEVNIGPTVTQFLIEPGYTERVVRGETKKTKIKVAKIAGLSNDLALALAAPSVRIEAPVLGTNYVGIEVPNGESNTVGLKELMVSDEYEALQRKAKLPIALGEDVKGKAVVTDLARMPHLLIAGATGSGKSACINSIICCLLLTHTPETLRMLMIDPKMVELTSYNGVPHLLSPVVTEVDKASGVLYWAVKEMERRYQLLNKANTRDLTRYNEYLVKRNEEALPLIVIIIDEMADLMMTAAEEVEKHVCRLAQMARAVGIHLIIATQRPSVDVITGLIKANFPTRIAFAVTSQIDSRVVLDTPGAERLLGRGDMLFMPPDASKLERLQGTFLNDDEINRIVRYWKGIRSLENYVQPPLPDLTEGADAGHTYQEDPQTSEDGWDDTYVVKKAGKEDRSTIQPIFEQIKVMKSVDGRDDLYEQAVQVVQNTGRGSVSLLQRKLRIGYARASRLVEQLEEAGVLGPDQGGTQGRIVYLDDPQRKQKSEDAPLTPRVIGDDDPPQIWM
jgi:DNA segregation ATPase FtsK/SpoIIIE, S-DNA-T family